jgi:hypothetical protein
LVQAAGIANLHTSTIALRIRVNGANPSAPTVSLFYRVGNNPEVTLATNLPIPANFLNGALNILILAQL